MVQENKIRHTKENVVKLLQRMEESVDNVIPLYVKKEDERMKERLIEESLAYWRVLRLINDKEVFEDYWDIYMKEEVSDKAPWED